MRNFLLLKILFLTLFSILEGSICLEKMTLEEKVGQLLLVSFMGEEITPEIEKLIKETQVGGVVYFAFSNGLSNPKQVRNLSAKLQSLSKIPLFIAIDHEGGRINHLKSGFTQFPSQRELGTDPLNVYAAAKTMAYELKQVGINLNLAPVVDVDSNPLNPVIRDRSFGNDPEKVALCGEMALLGYNEAEFLCCLKHFPGHGDTSQDSHLELPEVHKSLEELEKTELFPFKKLYPKADLIMTGHLFIPELDPIKPVTFSEKIINKMLREEWGYQGLVVSDSLIMQGLLKHSKSLEDAAEKAFKAGCDLLCIAGKVELAEKTITVSSQDISNVHQFLITAFKTGRISEKRLNESVTKILNLKKKYL